jgi:hypothetical protein
MADCRNNIYPPELSNRCHRTWIRSQAMGCLVLPTSGIVKRSKIIFKQLWCHTQRLELWFSRVGIPFTEPQEPHVTDVYLNFTWCRRRCYFMTLTHVCGSLTRNHFPVCRIDSRCLHLRDRINVSRCSFGYDYCLSILLAIMRLVCGSNVFQADITLFCADSLFLSWVLNIKRWYIPSTICQRCRFIIRVSV